MAETFAADSQSYEGKHFCGASAPPEPWNFQFFNSAPPTPALRLGGDYGLTEQMFGAE